MSRIYQLRLAYHQDLCRSIIRLRSSSGIVSPNFADGSSATSRDIARGIVEAMGCEPSGGSISGQRTGKLFEMITRQFIESAFGLLSHLRPGRWVYSTGRSIADFDQYAHLADLERIVEQNDELKAALGEDYIIRPDIVVSREPVDDAQINSLEPLVDATDGLVAHAPLRASSERPSRPLLHASISCKWTVRSDRAQNTRTEALNSIRNRKGHLPHVMIVTAEPMPTRLASLALGTGDVDCLYHIALHELEAALHAVKNEDQLDMFLTLVEGRRLRDISDLPFDLAT